jgi:hypothetical protein
MITFLKKVVSAIIYRVVLFFDFSQYFILRKLINQSIHKGFKEFSKGIELVKLTSDQKKEIKDYYKQTAGIKVSTKWHRLFYTLTGVFSPKYVPENYFLMDIIPSLMKGYFIRAYDDKNMYDRLFPDIKQPKVIVNRIHGFYYINSRAVSEKEAIEYCNNLDSAIIKPSLGANGGMNVHLLSVNNGVSNIDGLCMQDVFEKYGDDILIQEVITQHPDLSKLNSSSCNTMRIMSYLREDEVVIVGSVMRIGRGDTIVDNYAMGGIICGVNENGQLNKIGFTKIEGYLSPILNTDSGIVLENFQIPYYNKVIESIKKAHFLIPQIILVGWDYAINEKGEPILIEFNSPYDPNLQVAFGPAFGNYSDEIFSKVKATKHKCSFRLEKLYNYN